MNALGDVEMACRTAQDADDASCTQNESGLILAGCLNAGWTIWNSLLGNAGQSYNPTGIDRPRDLILPPPPPVD